MKFNFFRKLSVAVILISLVFIQSCKTDSDAVVKPGASGFFIVNEGGFGNGNTSISFYDRKTDEVTNDLFSSVNGRPLGDQSQSMTVFEGKGYIVVQNSSKIEVINTDDLKSFGSVTSVESPRYFLGISAKKGYVTDWGFDGVTGTVKVIDLTTLEVTKTIPTGKGANRMLKVNNLVYVANAGGYDKDNTVVIIDSNTDAIVTTITTGDNPNSIVKDKDGNIWVSASGNIDYGNSANSTKGSISKISATNTETLRLTVDRVVYNGPSNLDISPDGATLYYNYNGSIYSIATTSTALPTEAFKSKNYYGIAVDPFTGNVIGCNAPNFSSKGSIDVYDPAGTLIKTYEVGIAPNGCAFK
ncbi:MAG: hypothetical protein HOP08_20150 [Cyclobacteriaceae bacterium]|nr:hypothetical protein [Cyclobacteriaceae bacterium]